LAVGNPYGLDRTVTSGIVSAKQRRRLAQSAYQDFLQTDAAVNPGNSGGPLVNIQGQVVGITTAIIGPAYQGISFAIPSEIVRSVYERLRTSGKVARGWLGVSFQEITPEIAQQFNLTEQGGAIVADVRRGSPADRAGIQVGDVILEWNGEKVLDSLELPRMVAASEIGKTAKVVVLRDGKTITLEVTVGERPDEEQLRG
jgi:serine protease Do